MGGTYVVRALSFMLVKFPEKRLLVKERVGEEANLTTDELRLYKPVCKEFASHQTVKQVLRNALVVTVTRTQLRASLAS